MKILMTVVVAVVVAAGFSLVSAPEAKAGGCTAAYGCAAQVLVPTPQSIPLRRRWRRPSVVAAPCVAPCVARPAVVAPGPGCALCGAMRCPRAQGLLLPLPELLRQLHTAGLCRRL